MMTRWLLALTVSLVPAVACAPSPMAPQAAAIPLGSATTSASLMTPARLTTITPAGSTNGVAGSMPAYYDGQLLTINFKQLPPGGESANLTHNGSINTIYQSDHCMPGGQMFVSVLDAIQGDGFNPLWQEVQVVFNTPAACKQLTSDNDILAAAAAHTVTLVPTTELYRCAVIGQKP
jgi:hypothetical protein